MEKKIEDFERAELFNYYNNADNPFLYITTQIDVTNIVEFCKEHKNFYATMGYLLTKAVNNVDEFRYRFKDGEIYYYDRVKSNFTEKLDDIKIGFFDMPDIDNYKEYIDEYRKLKEKLLKDKKIITSGGLDYIWFSCLPWFEFTGILTPYRKSVSIPQFIWDKYREENGRYKMHLMIMANHGFVDGGHVAMLLELLEKEINNFTGDKNN